MSHSLAGGAGNRGRISQAWLYLMGLRSPADAPRAESGTPRPREVPLRDHPGYEAGMPGEWRAGVGAFHVFWRPFTISYGKPPRDERPPSNERPRIGDTYYRRIIQGPCPRCGGLVTRDISPVSSRQTLIRNKTWAALLQRDATYTALTQERPAVDRYWVTVQSVWLCS